MKSFTVGRYVEDDCIFTALMVEESGKKTTYRSMRDTETGRTYFVPGDLLPQKDTPEADILDGVEGWLVRSLHDIFPENYIEGKLKPDHPSLRKTISKLRSQIPTGVYVIDLDTTTRKAI